MFKSAGLAKMFAGRRKFFRGPHVRHLWFILLGVSTALFFLLFSLFESVNYEAPTVHSICDNFFFFFIWIFIPTQKHAAERKSKQANPKLNNQTL